jgi:outer membrane receptor protein involved in Fe transport
MTRSRKRKLARLRARWAGVPLASTLLAGGVAHGADAGDTGNTLEEVVVTAQKRTEDLQRVPISLEVLGAETLEEHQVSNFDDYAKLLPSLSYQSFGPGQSQLYFRGIASGEDGLHAGSLPATGVYVDEIPVTTIGNTLDVHVYDIARVEALAGPQGTLYGASSLSGTLRIITNKPDPTAFSAGYDVKADKYGKGNGGGEFEGFVNVPLTDHIAVRLVGYYDHQGGYINNVVGENTYQRGVPGTTDGAFTGPNDPLTVSNLDVSGRRFNPLDTYGGRGELKIDLNDNWSVTPEVLWQSQRADGNFTFDPRKGDLNVTDFFTEVNEDKWYQSALAVEGKVANFDILYSGGWFERNVHNLVDYSNYTVGYDALSQQPGAYYSATRYQDCKAGTPATNCNGAGGPLTNPAQFVNNHDKYTKMSHELRVTSPADFRLRGVAGVFYQRQTDDIRAAFQANGLPQYYSVDGQTDTIYLSQQTRVDRDYAVFSELTFDVTDQFKISGGIRKFWVENTLYGFFGFNDDGFSGHGEAECNPPVSAATIIPGYWPCVNTDKKVVESGETHKVNLSYQIDPDRMVYATYSTGFRPGGNNRIPNVAAYGSDRLVNIELGWKTSWLDNRLRTNGAVFRERWDDMQLSVFGNNGITSIVNAANAEVKGVESDISWLLVDNLTLSGSGTFVNARTTQDYCNLDPNTEAVTHTCADPAAPSGTALPVTPKLKINGTARYKFDVGDYASFVQGTVIHQSSSTSALITAQNNLTGNLPHFTTFDLSAGTGMKNWHLEAYIENVFDKRGELARVTQCTSAAVCYSDYRVFAIKPMNFGLKFGQKF